MTKEKKILCGGIPKDTGVQRVVMFLLLALIFIPTIFLFLKGGYAMGQTNSLPNRSTSFFSDDSIPPSTPTVIPGSNPTPTTCPAGGTSVLDTNDSNFQLVHRCTGNLLNTNYQVTNKKPVCECTFQDVIAQIQLIIKFVLWIASFYAIGVLVYAGFLYMSSQGNPSKVSKAKGLFINIVVGISIIVLAYFVVMFILDSLNVLEGYRGVSK